MKFMERKMDLFDIDPLGDLNTHYVQCISADFGMGKGIAVEFNKRFDMKNKVIEKYGQGNYDTVGKCIYVDDIPVLNLVTKVRYWNKPSYSTIETALFNLRKTAELNNIHQLAMPRIGCGLDGLEWDKVKNIISDIFNDSNIDIIVCYL